MDHGKTQVFTNYELSRLGKCTDKTVDFDLSRISSDQLNGLINTLRVRGKKDFTEISLNFDLLMKTKARNRTTLQSKSETRTTKSRISQPYALEMSAIGRRKNFTGEIAEVLAGIISESRTLLKIKLRSIHFNQLNISCLSKSLTAAHSIRSLHLCDIPMGDCGFEILVRALKRELITDLQCRKCNLTDASSRTLHSLISYHVSIQSEVAWRESLAAKTSPPIVCLSKLDLRDNDYTYNMIRVIHDAILDLPITLLDLRGNIGITETVVQQLQSEIPHTDIKTGISQPIRSRRPKKQMKRKSLVKENNKLRGLVDTLKRGSEIVEIMPDLAIVGPRANELAAHIRNLDKILSTWSNGPRPFFHGSNEIDDQGQYRPNSRMIARKSSVPKKKSNTTTKKMKTASSNRRSQSTSRRGAKHPHR